MTTYYLNPVSGNNGNAGTSFGAAWATLQYAMDNATTAGDIVICCNTGTESTAAQIDADTNSGSASQYIKFVAGDASGNIDPAERYTVQASAAITAVLSIAGATHANYLYFRGIIFNANSNATYAVANPTNDITNNSHVFQDCTATGATSHGWYLRSVNSWRMLNCHAYLNGGAGVAGAAASRGACQWVGGSIHDNTGNGINLTRANSRCSAVLIYDNGGDGVNIESGASQASIEWCTIYGNTGDGIDQGTAGATQITLISNTITANGGWGVNASTSAAQIDRIIPWDYSNIDGSNTSGTTNRSGGLPGDNNTTTDPAFTSVTDGSEDFEPTSSSPLIQAGPNASNVGAVGNAVGAGGGGGLLTHPGMSGGMRG